MMIKEIDNDTYCLLSSEKVPAWRVPYSKLSDRNTVMQETTANFGAELGVSIDIFPLDNWCNNRLIADLQARYCGLLRRFMSASIEETFYSPQKGVRRLVLYGIWRFSRCCGCGFFRKLVLNEAKRYQGRKTQLIGCVAWAAYGKREITPADVFGEKAVGEFEGNSYPIPSGYYTYLQNLYGDYKSELPIEKQKSHHMFIVWRKNV